MSSRFVKRAPRDFLRAPCSFVGVRTEFAGDSVRHDDLVASTEHGGALLGCVGRLAHARCTPWYPTPK